MRRAHARDPRSILELRRLAYKAKRTPGMREVLHDALLETFPAEYEEAIQRAYQEAESHREKFIVFLPSRLSRSHRKHPPEMLFVIRDNMTIGQEDTTTKALEARFFRKPEPGRTNFGGLPNIPSFRSAVIVYRTRGEL